MNYIDASEAEDMRDGAIKLHSAADFEGMRKAGRLAAECLDMLVPLVKPGVTTAELDKAAFEFVIDNGAVPACLGYRGYQHTVCTSVNHVVCHGIPGPKPLKNGDSVNIDVTVIVDGWHGDTHGERCSVVQDFCGHGLGRLFHDAPNILHFGRPGEGEELREGMFFTIEPMINLGKPDTKILSDGWTAVTRDRKLTAQFEHSIGVTADGCEIFTLSPKGLHKPPYV